MSRTKLIVLAAMALLFAQLQCTAACATRLCKTDSNNSESLPPCHRHHHSPSHDQTSGSCVHQIVVVPTPSQQLLQMEMPAFPVMNAAETVIADFLADSGASTHNHLAPSPPGFQSRSSVVLRI